MRAFAITFDAMVALSFLFVAAVMVHSTTFQPSAHKGMYLKEFTLDVLTVLEKTGELGNFADGNSNGTRYMLESTPPSICMEVSVTDSSNEQVAVVAKTTCGEIGRAVQVSAKPFTHEGLPYMAKARSWYKKEIS